MLRETSGSREDVENVNIRLRVCEGEAGHTVARTVQFEKEAEVRLR